MEISVKAWVTVSETKFPTLLVGSDLSDMLDGSSLIATGIAADPSPWSVQISSYSTCPNPPRPINEAFGPLLSLSVFNKGRTNLLKSTIKSETVNVE